MNSVYILKTNDSRTVGQLVEGGNYDLIDMLGERCVWNMKYLEMFRRTAETVETKVVLELVEFKHEPTQEEVLAEFVRQGLERPTREDALRFGEQHPAVQRKFPIAFLHEPYWTSNGSPWALTLSYDVEDGRELGCGWFGRGWKRVRHFAARRCCLTA